MRTPTGATGPMDVEIYLLPDCLLEVVVRDRGRGIGASDLDDGERATGTIRGIPRLVISARSRSSGPVPAPGLEAGTEVRMQFAASGHASSLAQPGGPPAPPPTQRAPWLRRSIPWPTMRRRRPLVSVASALSARSVLPRLLCFWPRAPTSRTDRISDAEIVADALAANADDSINGSHLDVGITIGRRNLDLRVGPLREGRGESLVAVAADGLAPVIERLTDAKRVARDDAGETLELRLIDQG